MIATLQRLFERYRMQHESQPTLQWIGVVGLVAFPALYLLRLTAIVPPRYDDVAWRLVATLLCIGLALRSWWPQRLRRYYLGFSYLVVFYCLSFLLTFTSMMNQGGALSVVNMIMGTILIILLADWRNAVVMLVGGYALAAAAYFRIEPGSHISPAIAGAALTSILVVVAGALSHTAQKRAEHERLRRVYAGLAAAIAHEVRTPLAQVQHALLRIGSQVPEGSDASSAVRSGLGAVQRGLQSVAITLQQIGDRPMQRGEFVTLSAARCARAAVADYAYESDHARDCVKLEIASDFHFSGDATAFELVVFNLLRNALYYLPLHPDMAVVIRVASDPFPHLTIRDTGPGIDPRLVGKLFQEFQTLGKAEGTGLGLSFCRRIMRDFGGDITCLSEPGRFTEFTLSFPGVAASSSLPAVETTDSAPGALTNLVGCTILVVDDQPLNRTIAHALLGDLGVNVLEAEHGQQVLDRLQQGLLPDAILMDINMPGIDGFGTTRRLRMLPGEASRVPVLALTANDSPQVLLNAREAGMQAVLAKPIDRGPLERALTAAMAGRASAPVASPPATDGLINTVRLASFRRLGLLDELLPQALRDLTRHLQTLENAAATGQESVVTESLHALVGLAGDAGAQALHARARERYAAWLDGQRPAGTAWVRELTALLDETRRAMEQFAQAQAEAPGPASDHA